MVEMVVVVVLRPGTATSHGPVAMTYGLCTAGHGWTWTLTLHLRIASSSCHPSQLEPGKVELGIWTRT